MRKYDYRCAYVSESEYECGGYSLTLLALSDVVATSHPTRLKRGQHTMDPNGKQPNEVHEWRLCRGGDGGVEERACVLGNKYGGFPLNVNAILARFSNDNRRAILNFK